MRVAIVIVVLAVIAVATAARADVVRLDVTTADANRVWVRGHAAPWVVRVTGLTRGTVRVDCFSPAASYVRAHDVRNNVPTPAVTDFPPRALPASEQISCTAYRDNNYVASWQGTLAWPQMTLPDHRITSLGAQRCGPKWCVDVALDRSHPGTAGADVEVLCTLRHASTDVFFTTTAPWSRAQVRTTKDRVRLELDHASGATEIACNVDRGLYGNARYADADPKNNEATTTVANASSTNPLFVFASVANQATLHPGCGNCSTYIPGALTVAIQIRNTGTAGVDGLGMRCEATRGGTRFQLRGATGPLAVNATRDISASIAMSSDTHTKLVGSLQLRCDAIAWDRPTTPVASWTGTVAFPSP